MMWVYQIIFWPSRCSRICREIGGKIHSNRKDRNYRWPDVEAFHKVMVCKLEELFEINELILELSLI